MKKILLFLFIAAFSNVCAQEAQLLMDINSGSDGSFRFSFDRAMIEYDDKFFFTAVSDEFGAEIYVYDGNEVKLLKDINPGVNDAAPDNFHILNGKLLFFADDGTHGKEIWLSDGTEAGTVMMTDLQEGTADGVVGGGNTELQRSSIVFNNEFYFNARIEDNLSRFWKTDGTPEGTIELAMLNHPQRLANGLTEFQGALYFKATFEGFWKTDGTPEGTVLIKEKDHEDNRFDPIFITDMGDYMIMVNGSDWDVWRSDGTPEGTTIVKEMVDPRAQNNMGKYFINYNGIALFTGAQETNNGELWRSDGTDAGTTEVIDIEDNDAFIPKYPKRKVLFKDEVYYIGGKDETGTQIYKTDGTSANTKEISHLQDKVNGQVYFQSDLVNNEEYLFFVGGRSFNRELWVSDGTSDGTIEIPINPSGESTPERLFIYKDKLLFFAFGDGIGYEPHYVDINAIRVNIKDYTYEDKYEFYPNPTSDKLFTTPEIRIGEVFWYNMNGQLIYSEKFQSNIDTRNLDNGIYFAEIIDIKEQKAIRQKVIIQR